MTVTIKLGANKTTDWGLTRITRLARSSASRKKLLGMYQVYFLYCVCNGVKRDKAMCFKGEPWIQQVSAPMTEIGVSRSCMYDKTGDEENVC